ncbi:MAG: erythromycin esterase family protein [Actinophytocola sp.]|uniref:erythromycin esterase family protein n=1 Tax=Actinophytocola sp. TaxID=1872138 RepID=UPI003D6BDC3A
MDPRDVTPLYGPGNLDPLLDRIGRARFVLVGEATHGTSEFYRWRAELTKRLVAERGFDFVGVEGDWPDCHRLHCCVAGAPGIPKDPAAVLWEMRRWPRWLWANEEVVDFAGWLREFNARRPRPVGFHGLDVYSLWDSLRAALDHLREHSPDRVADAIAAYRCFEPYGQDQAAALPDGCSAEVGRLLARRRPRTELASLPGLDPAFVAWLNTEVPANAERYHRELLRGDHRSWNVREQHLADTLDRLAGAYGPGAKAVVWAHNAHVGDAAATDMAAAGMTNLGRLVRERHGEDTVLVGFGTYEGSVLAAQRWDGPVRRLRVPPAAPGSVEARWHEILPDTDGLVVFPRGGGPAWTGEVRDHRAIGLVYDGDRPGTYVPTVLRRRYDAFVHCDRSTAVTPLHRVETRETLPVGE